MFFFLGLLLFTVAASFLDIASAQDPDCLVFISEIFMPAEDSNVHDFVEFKSHCSKLKKGPKSPQALKNFKLLMLDMDKRQILLACDLGDRNYRFREGEKFHVFGGVGFAGSESESTIMQPSVLKIPSPDRSFPRTKSKVYSIILIRNTAYGIANLRLLRGRGGIFEPRDFTSSMEKLVKDNIVDAIVLCYESSCAPVPSWFQELSNQQQPLIAFSSRSSLSLNSCATNPGPWSQRAFRYGNPTPGQYNDCSLVDGPSTGAETCPSSTNVIRDTFTSYRDIMGLKGAAPTYGNIFKRQTQAITRPQQVKVFRESHPFVYNKDSAERCRKYFPHGGTVLDEISMQKWLALKPVDSSCEIKCSACAKFFEYGFRVDMNKALKRKKITNQGVIPKSPCDALNILRDHEDDEVHRLAIMFLKTIENHKSEAGFLKAVEEYELAEYELFLPTAILVNLAYTAHMTGVSFSAFRPFVDSSKSVGMNLGHRHFDRDGSTSVLKVISDEYHRILLTRLVRNQNPFSLMADSSTDVSNNPLLSVVIVSLEDNKYQDYFYRLVLLNQGETAVGMFKSFTEAVEKDEKNVPGFRDFWTRNLVGFSSDNAKVMAGSGQSFYTNLRDHVNHGIVQIGCSNHKLELAIGHAVTSKDANVAYFENIERDANKLYTYYMSKGSKRWFHLKETACTMNEPADIVRLKQYCQIRWASSHVQVLKSVYKDFDVIMADLIRTKLDARTSRDIVAVDEVWNIINDKNFALYLHESLDFMEVFSQISLQFEESRTTLIGKYQIIQNVISVLKALQNVPGSTLQKFMKSCRCDGLCELGACSLEDLQKCIYMTCADYVYMNNQRTNVPLATARKVLYDRLVSEINRYFNVDELECFELFDLRNFLATQPSALNKKAPRMAINSVATDARFRQICKVLSYNSSSCQSFSSEYIKFLTSVTQGGTAELDRDPLTEFWPEKLSNDDLNTFVNETVRKVLVLPFSSAACERSFSFMTKVKSRDRSSMSTSSLEHIIRVKYNGPKDLDLFDLPYYNKKYLEKHVRTDDVTAGGRPPLEKKQESKGSKYF